MKKILNFLGYSWITSPTTRDCELSSKDFDPQPTSPPSPLNDAATLDNNEAENEITKEKGEKKEFREEDRQKPTKSVEKALEWLARTVKREYKDKPELF